jgi:hypothetical protein
MRKKRSKKIKKGRRKNQKRKTYITKTKGGCENMKYTVYRVSISLPFKSFAKHETMRNKKLVSRNFACFAKQIKQRNFVSFCFVKGNISFRFVNFFWFRFVNAI